MRIQEIDYPIEQQEFIAKCRQIGVVLSICILEFENAANNYEISRQAAIEAMKIYSKKYSNQYYQITIDQNIEPKGRKIKVGEFLGKGFDFQNQRVKIFSYNGGSRSNLISDGLLRALLNPPYSLRLNFETEAKPFSVEYGIAEQAKMAEVFFEFLDKILGVKDLPDFYKYEIYKWSDDWSNYFNAGKEWWGTYYWTLLDLENRKITVLGGSATD